MKGARSVEGDWSTVFPLTTTPRANRIEKELKKKRLPHTLESEIEPKTQKSLEIHVRVLVVLDRTKTWGRVSEIIRSNFEFAGTLIRSSLKVETERNQEHLKARSALC